MEDQHRFERLVERVGQDLYSRNPTVYAACNTVLAGSDPVDALIAAVRCLAESNDTLMKQVTHCIERHTDPLIIPGTKHKSR